MREILFRGKRTDSGKWVKGYLYITHIGAHEIGSYDAEINIERSTFDVIPETVGQYTGLTDKNGVRIFEGDIVKHYNTVYEISYITKYTRFAGRNGSCIFAGIPLENTEVIGNIHDNPELLEKAENP